MTRPVLAHAPRQAQYTVNPPKGELRGRQGLVSYKTNEEGIVDLPVAARPEVVMRTAQASFHKSG